MRVAVLNKISREILKRYFGVFEETELSGNPDIIFLRSYDLKKTERLPESVLAVGRAGTGVNNIPLDWCNEHGVAVFNAPGANANAVRELVCAALVIAARPLLAAANFVNAAFIEARLNGLPKPDTEKDKSLFRGIELRGKTVLVLGLGKIGREVARLCLDLRMQVLGFDPYAEASSLPRGLELVSSLEDGAKRADFVTLHTALSKETRGMIGKFFFENLKPGARILNFARSEVVDISALCQSIKIGTVRVYVCDFPEMALIDFMDSARVVCFPHLGASTSEAEENAANSVASSVAYFHQDGRVENSVNFPNFKTPKRAGVARLLISNENVPGVLARVTNFLVARGFNIDSMFNEPCNPPSASYTVIDIDNPKEDMESARKALSELRGVQRVRVIR